VLTEFDALEDFAGPGGWDAIPPRRAAAVLSAVTGIPLDGRAVA